MNPAKLMERRLGARSPTDFALTAYRDGIAQECRAMDLSPGGALLRHRLLRRRPLVQRLELALGSAGAVVTHARTAWSRGPWQAVKFVGLGDADRLDIAEYLDALERRRRCSFGSR